MMKCSTMLVAGVTFTVGLILGLVLHLPGASSPQSRPVRSISDNDPVYNNQKQPDLAFKEFEDGINIVKNSRQHPSAVLGTRSLLNVDIGINSPGEGDINYNKQKDGNGKQINDLSIHRNTLEMRRNKKIYQMYRKHSKEQVSEGMQSEDIHDISLENKSGGRGYTFSKQATQYDHENNKQDKGLSNKESPSLEHISMSKFNKNDKNKNIDISSAYEKDLVLSKYDKKPDVNNGNYINSKHLVHKKIVTEKMKFNNKPMPGGIHTSNDKQDKLAETPSVEMSVSVIDVASNKGGNPLFKSQKTPSSDIISNERQPILKVINPESQHATSDQIASTNKSLHGQFKHLWEIVEDNVYWSSQLERLTPKGFSEIQSNKWREHAQTSKIMELKEGCGRMQNRLIVFSDGTKMCARYRINTDQIQGEVYSYYLAQVLGIENVLPPILTKANPSDPQWSKVANAIDAAEWNPQKIFVLTPWLENLQPAYIPKEFHVVNHKLSPVSKHLVNKTLDHLTELVQWSDLIVLDYLTGNVDRVVNNMFNLQWNSGMMTAPTHNLERVGQSGPLVFLDNESGLLHSYRLLDKYNQYHEQLLRSLCIFRKSTVDRIISLFQNRDITQKIKDKFRSLEPLASQFPFIPQQNLSVLSQRLTEVYRQIIHCERHYAKSNT